MTVDLRHLELAVPEDLLQGEQVAAGHGVVAGEGVAQRVPRADRDVAARCLQNRLNVEHVVGGAHTLCCTALGNDWKHQRAGWAAALPLAQDRGQRRMQRHGAPFAGLGRLPVGMGDVDGTTLEQDVDPTQAEQLPLAHPRVDGRRDHRK